MPDRCSGNDNYYQVHMIEHQCCLINFEQISTSYLKSNVPGSSKCKAVCLGTCACVPDKCRTWPMGLFWASRSVSKTFLELTNVDYKFLFGKYSPIFLFLIRPNFGPFCTFWALRGYLFLACWAIFGVKVRFKIIFGTY